MFRRITPLLAALSLAAVASAQTLTPNFVDVSYGPHPRQKLDVYLAPSASPTPVLIEIHPGGWAGGAKSTFSVYGPVLDRVFAKGISIVSIDFPQAPADLYPAGNLSCQRAVQFVRANAAAWNLDVSRIALFGTSSGGHLASWVAMSADAANAASPDPIVHFSSRVPCVVLLEGPTDLTDAYYKYDPNEGHASGSSVWQYMGVTSQAAYEAIPLAVKQGASPRWLAANGAGPVPNAAVRFFIASSGDPTITQASQLPAPAGGTHELLYALAMREALDAIGAPADPVWIGNPLPPPGAPMSTGDLVADWLALRFSDATIARYGHGTPGCVSTHPMLANGPAHVGGAGFRLFSYDASAGTTGALVISDAPEPVGIDLFGVRLLVNAASGFVLILNMPSDAEGKGTTPLPIPNVPALVGATVYAQTLWPWTSGPCVPSSLQLSASEGLAITFQP